MFSTIASRLKNLNFFASPVTANNEYEIQNERISTRVFIIILSVCTLSILIYTIQVSVTKTIDVTNPSYEQFQFLSLHYLQTLQCPCDNIAIPYENFILLEPRFHQLCSSDFIKQDWINYIGSATGTYVSQDFSYSGRLIFLTLASFCQRASETIMTALETFNSTRFITAQAVIENVFDEQVNALIESFRSSVELYYYQLFSLIQFSTETNTLLTGLFSNIQFVVDPSTLNVYSSTGFTANLSCNCATTSSCIAPLTLQDRRTNQNSSSSSYKIPGLVTSCYLVDAVRQSSLECFYQASCISTIELYLQAPQMLNNPISLLNSTIDSRFNVWSTVDQFLSKAMTEQWNENVSHSEYFAQCKVLSCTYLVTSKFNIVYIVTTLLGLIGGLTKVLRLLIPYTVKLIRHWFVPPTSVQNAADVIHVSLLERLRTFNYFSKPLSLSNEQERKQQIVATRVFILLLLVSFIILISYYGAERVTTTYEIKSPTFEHFINLQNDQYYNPSFSCPCSTITISYEAFIQLNYTLHPFCSSDFVQQQWLNYSLDPSVVHLYYDFRALTPVLFNSLASFCKVSAEYINNELISFNASSFIADQAVSPETFVVKTNAIADTFISSTSRSFAANLALIRNTTQTNAIMSTYMTNFIIRLSGTYPTYSLTYYDTTYSIPSGNTSVECACGSFEGCTIPISIYFLNSSIDYYVRLLDIPGLFVDCLIIDGIRKSSFICLFNQSCVDLMSFWLNISTVNAIDSHDLIHFDVNSTIDDIINETFVDQWTISASHRAFYQECSPNYCSYSLNQHNSVWIILTVVLSLIGGLTKILQVLVPFLVQGVFTLYDRCSHRTHRTTDSASVPVNFSFRFIIDRIHKFNLFSSNSPITADNEHEIRGQIISTRLFLVFLLISLIILTIYSSQVQVTKTITITNPSMEQYLSLYNNHSLTLTCPCKNIDIPQQTFLNLQPTFHQVCESDFVDPRWSDGIYISGFYTYLYYRDIRSFGAGFFNTIASFCQLSLSTINDRLLDFGGSSFVTAEIISQDLLLKQGQALIDLFISTNKNAFVSSLQTIRDTTQVNTLISGDETSMSIKAKASDETNIQLITSSRVYNTSSVSCSCYSDPTCTAVTGLYLFSNKTITYIIPGFYIGCYVVEGTLKSNLFSLYNQSWIDNFRTQINFDYYNPVYIRSTALNSSLNSTYNITTPINDIMQNMMTEYWYTNVNYSAYYEQCDPIECKYTYAIKYDLVYIVTTIIGLIGGLVTIFQLIIPRVVKIIQKCWLNRRRYPNVRVVPMIQVAQNQ